jgi:hypothetical protein
MVVFLQIYNIYPKSMLFRGHRMYQILDFFAIYFGLTQMKSKDGETMIGAFHSYLVKILLKSFAKNMI